MASTVLPSSPRRWIRPFPENGIFAGFGTSLERATPGCAAGMGFALFYLRKLITPKTKVFVLLEVSILDCESRLPDSGVTCVPRQPPFVLPTPHGREARRLTALIRKSEASRTPPQALTFL